MATIMTVEDSPSTRRIIINILLRAGHEVIDAASGAEALQKLSGNKVDLIITDVNMPNMNGFELTTLLRMDNNFKFTPILMITSQTSEAQRLKGREAGASGWIVKPFNPNKLIQIVDKVLR